jgi:hypothetical protein
MHKFKFITVLFLCLIVLANSSNGQPRKKPVPTTPQAATAGPPSGRSYLDGVLFAPPGTTVILQKDGIEDLSLTASANGNAGFSSDPRPLTQAGSDRTIIERPVDLRHTQ